MAYTCSAGAEPNFIPSWSNWDCYAPPPPMPQLHYYPPPPPRWWYLSITGLFCEHFITGNHNTCKTGWRDQGNVSRSLLFKKITQQHRDQPTLKTPTLWHSEGRGGGGRGGCLRLCSYLQDIPSCVIFPPWQNWSADERNKHSMSLFSIIAKRALYSTRCCL